jgi:hypothetical protein
LSLNGGSFVLLDGALRRGFDETGPLLIGLAWLSALTIVVALTFRHTTEPATRQERVSFADAPRPRVNRECNPLIWVVSTRPRPPPSR